MIAGTIPLEDGAGIVMVKSSGWMLVSSSEVANYVLDTCSATATQQITYSE